MRVAPVEWAGVRSPVAHAGDETARTAVVLVHGNPGSWRDWEDLMGRIAPFARVVAPDMPGFGRADRPRDLPATVEGYARHLEGVLERVGVDRVHLVLHDFGGPWGLEWAIRNPGALGSVTLVNTGVFVRYRWHLLARIWRTPVLGELFQAAATRAGTRAIIDATNPKPLPRAFLDRMYDDIDRGTKRTILRLYRATEPGALERRQAPALREQRPPAHVVWGAGDPYLGTDLAHRQREVFPDAEVVVLDGCGHWPMADEPERLAGAVLPFLRAQLAAPA